jgi:hypothetical protein
MALPPSHLSVARWFDAIIGQGELRPRMCPVFNETLIYLFYGGVFYRTGNKPTRNAAELPIAFLFDPRVLKCFFRYYPFDTGALATGRYGEVGNRLLPFEERYAINGDDEGSVPTKMVYFLYQTNERYLKGYVNDDLAKMPNPLPELCAFLKEDLSDYQVDQRQTVIECHLKQSMPLNQGLLWIGFPETMTDVFSRLYDLTKPSMPDYFRYESHLIFNPAEIAAKLEMEAAKVVKRFQSLPMATGAR